MCLKAAARVCFSVRVQFSTIQAFYFLAWLIFFQFFLWTCLSKYRWNDMRDTIKHSEQQTSSTMCSVLYLVHPKIKFHIYTEQSCDWLKLKLSVAQKKKKKKVIKKKKKMHNRSSFPICHKLWDMEFFFL